ncbi:SDR family oxidoreductase [Pelomonas cellulosilytica]|uniref:SDR family oxidoreductase n=1 Tax=Pelomonas cellulosilytica TaxID=2906762 RepID=A0ABS8Y186_9BURK|nr:SDR family oxidoreductase [Pelomonas sp. P8]MCE4557403.1 SDR family oxidoreductase [Pelomonas sp. P8]
MSELVFITGASSGIGQALALRLYRDGARLALVARRTAEVERWAAEQGLDAARFRVYGADVADVPAITGVGRDCIATQGVPDIVIACAGISVGMDTAQFEDLDVMRRVFAINNVGLAATFHPFIVPMRARRSGTLVGVASVSAIRGLPGHGAYCASKSGVVAYCESLRVECRGSGLGVVTLLPGYIDTPLTRGNRYRMPFLMPVDAFAEQAVRAIRAQASYRVIPWQMGVLAKVLRLLPNGLYDWLLSRRGRKRREGG